MAADIATDRLIGEWVHSHEEDDGPRRVFRPSGFAFPPSRGRTGFRLEPDGAATVEGPGPDDRRRRREGRWTLQGSRLTISGPGWSYAYDIESLDASALVVLQP